MEVSVSWENQVAVVEPNGRIDSNSSRVLGERLRDVIGEARTGVVVDLGRVVYVTSAGFRVLLIAARAAADKGCSFALCNMSPEVRRLFEVGAFLDVFRVHVSRQECVAAASPG